MITINALNRSLLLFLLIITCHACNNDIFEDSDASQLVVEGWIDEGRPPIVIVTSVIIPSTTYQYFDSLENHIIKWAKVSISDGTKSVILTGMYSSKYFPPYIYTTSDMIGEAGKTYKLDIEYNSMHVTASTTIPGAISLDSITTEKVNNNDSLRLIKAYFNAPTDKDDYYKFFTRKLNERNSFLSSYLGIVNTKNQDPSKGISVNQGRTNLTSNYTPYFLKGDSIIVKFAHIDYDCFQYWKDFENSASFSRNPLQSSFNNLKGNVSGAIGYFWGYGAKQYLVVPK